MLVSLAVAAAPAAAIASPSPDASQLLQQLVESERAPIVLGEEILGSNVVGAPIPRPPLALADSSALDCVHAVHDITVDPATGVTTGSIELRVKAVGEPLRSVGFVIDDGLRPGDVEATGRDVSVVDAVFKPTRVVRIDFTRRLAPGEETVVTMQYSGTLSCGAPSSGPALCSKNKTFSYFAHKSIFPYIFDPEAPASVVLDGLTRDIVIRAPAAHDIVVTGQKVSEVRQGRMKVTRWSIDKPLSRTVGLYALVGDLGVEKVSGRNVPTTFVYPAPRTAFDDELVSWSAPALDFVEKASGAMLPFDRSLTLVRLPKALGDPGTATFGMTLLSDSYASSGKLMYEETWAHENTHLFWGITVPETDPNESRLMSEGMATLTQVDYSYGRHFSSEDRDLYLARRFAPMGLDLRLNGSDLPPPVAVPGTKVPTDFRASRYTLWAYFRTALALDHLRVTLGEDTFADVLRAYDRRCRYVGCRPDVLRVVASETTGKDMSPFFARWVTANERPRVVIGFEPVASGAEVELTKADNRPMTLALWLGLADGSRLERRVDLGGRTTRVHLDAPSPVVEVSTNPRHEVLVDVRSAVEGDVDFDGETDGFDILRCARLVGQKYATKGASGLWNVGETFDPRCDVDDNLSIDEDDLAQLAEKFGKLRPR